MMITNPTFRCSVFTKKSEGATSYQYFQTPISSSNLLWLIDTNYESSVFSDDERTTQANIGNKVGGLTDLSGQGTHWTQSSTSAQPVYKVSGTGSYKVLDFGTDASASFDFARKTNVCTIFWVVQQIGNETGYRNFLLGDSSVYDFHAGITTKIFSNLYSTVSNEWLNNVKGALGTFDHPKRLAVIAATHAAGRACRFSLDRSESPRSWCGHLLMCMAYNKVLTDDEISTINLAIKTHYGNGI